MYLYHGDPDTCRSFIRGCAYCLDMASSEFNKVSFMVLCLRDRPLQWAADYFEVHPIRTVSFWDFAKKLQEAFGRDSPPPTAHAPTSSMSPPSAPRHHSLPVIVQTIRTGFISFSPDLWWSQRSHRTHVQRWSHFRLSKRLRPGVPACPRGFAPVFQPVQEAPPLAAPLVQEAPPVAALPVQEAPPVQETPALPTVTSSPPFETPAAPPAAVPAVPPAAAPETSPAVAQPPAESSPSPAAALAVKLSAPSPALQAKSSAPSPVLQAKFSAPCPAPPAAALPLLNPVPPRAKSEAQPPESSSPQPPESSVSLPTGQLSAAVTASLVLVHRFLFPRLQNHRPCPRFPKVPGPPRSPGSTACVPGPPSSAGSRDPVGYCFSVAILPDSPRPRSTVAGLPDSPHPRSPIAGLPDSPYPRSPVANHPDSPCPWSPDANLPDAPGSRSPNAGFPVSPGPGLSWFPVAAPRLWNHRPSPRSPKVPWLHRPCPRSPKFSRLPGPCRLLLLRPRPPRLPSSPVPCRLPPRAYC
ncbi:vegetative cell wall protein gp1-like [Nothobranchius furzeri]|uniref:Vegetative cell wall protein gp1-like n=1 Tax=Nothobranchius furzeri TaxID=105023 RepID=A0A9D3BZK7_NOTFU|nr:vegetative cell wall protein gp1-like [Nothobranchius furzeri]